MSEGMAMRRIGVWAVLLACLGAMPIGAADWLTHSGDVQRTGWQKAETKIAKDTVRNLQLLWKIRLETKQRSVYSLYGPLIVERAITDRGFKEIAFVAGAGNDLFAVDADLGTLLWKKHFDWHADVPETEQANFLCPGGLTAWPVLQPVPARGRGAPPSPLPLTVTYDARPTQRCCNQNASSVKPSSTMASTAARPGSYCAPATAKKILIESTSKLPDSTIGLPKSARLSTKPSRNALASAGRSSGQVTVRKTRPRVARSVCAASSSAGLTAVSAPCRSKNAIGEKVSSCASATPGSP